MDEANRAQNHAALLRVNSSLDDCETSDQTIQPRLLWCFVLHSTADPTSGWLGLTSDAYASYVLKEAQKC